MAPEVPVHAGPPSKQVERKSVLVEGEQRLLASLSVNLVDYSQDIKGKRETSGIRGGVLH